MIIAIQAAALGLNPLIRGRTVFRLLECEGLLPLTLPRFLPAYVDLLDMCSNMEGPHATNLQCECDGPRMICGSSRTVTLQRLVYYCSAHCNCGPDSVEDRSASTTKLDGATGQLAILKQSSPLHTCAGSCTSVARGCAWRRECVCSAPPVSAFFWHQGVCGSRHSAGRKRELPPAAKFAKNRNTKVMGPSDVDHPPNSSTSARQNPTSLVDQLALKNIPAPCNESYVSYACYNSIDGIVNEPLENWLGALLPKNTAEIPPVPKVWLQIHGLEDEMENPR